MRILGIDPGMTTGYALYDTQTSKYTVWEHDSRDLLAVWQLLQDFHPHEIVYEDFKHRPNLMKAELFSVEVIAVIKLYDRVYSISIHGNKQVIIKNKYLPASAKSFWTDRKIKSLSLWEPGKGHAMDALRVLLKYLGERDPQWFKETIEILKPNLS